ncbi:MAG: hypothetical protein QM729_14385 [Solirubrobacterales bacterium]
MAGEVAYVGTTTPVGASVVVRDGTSRLPLPPAGDGQAGAYTWGTAGSHPVELARAILADASGDQAVAGRLSMAFTWEVVAGLPADFFTLRRTDVLDWIDHHAAAAV